MIKKMRLILIYEIIENLAQILQLIIENETFIKMAQKNIDQNLYYKNDKF